VPTDHGLGLDDEERARQLALDQTNVMH
jgi:hypothetical protein